MFWNTFLSILGVIGIIAVATFVIVFLSDLFISIIDGSNGIFFKRNKNKVDNQQEEQNYVRPKLLNEPVKQIEQKNEVVEEKFEPKSQVNEDKDVDLKKADEEEVLARQNSVVQTRIEEPVSQVEPEPVVEKVEKVEEVPPFDVYDGADDFIAMISQETRKELEEIQRIEDEKNQAVEKERQESLAREQELQNQIEELRKQIEENQQTIKTLEEKNLNKEESPVVSGQTREELESRLEVLKQRLKENEKELSANRKEYAPLRRVNMTLDSDKRKLRRKEAIVAKQKVVLYGVNNYVDIDEEKAKKLAEELDLLEGLRLSVQHCEEVMQKNKDRYPILERTNKFLVKSQSQLKSDIADIESKIALLDAQNSENSGDDDTTNNDTTNNE